MQGKMSFKIAFGGIASALCVLIMLLTAIIPFLTYAAPMIAGLLIYAVGYECGKKTGIGAYISVSALLLILSPEKESAFMFAFFFGYYPIFSVSIDRIRSKAVRWILRFLLFNASMTAAYYILLKVLVAVDSEEFTKYSMLILLAMGNVLLVLYEFMFRKLTEKYIKVYRKKLFRRK